jgi:hypothetical protein
MRYLILFVLSLLHTMCVLSQELNPKTKDYSFEFELSKFTVNDKHIDTGVCLVKFGKSGYSLSIYDKTASTLLIVKSVKDQAFYLEEFTNDGSESQEKWLVKYKDDQGYDNEIFIVYNKTIFSPVVRFFHEIHNGKNHKLLVSGFAIPGLMQTHIKSK